MHGIFVPNALHRCDFLQDSWSYAWDQKCTRDKLSRSSDYFGIFPALSSRIGGWVYCEPASKQTTRAPVIVGEACQRQRPGIRIGTSLATSINVTLPEGITVEFGRYINPNWYRLLSQAQILLKTRATAKAHKSPSVSFVNTMPLFV